VHTEATQNPREGNKTIIDQDAVHGEYLEMAYNCSLYKEAITTHFKTETFNKTRK